MCACICSSLDMLCRPDFLDFLDCVRYLPLPLAVAFQWLLAIAFLDIPCFLDFLDILFSPLIFFVLSQSLLEVLTTD